MLQAMNTGHDGSLTTAHANSARDALARIETMVMMSGMELPVTAIRQQCAGALDLIVQQARLRDGSRKITSICEITGMEGDIITTQEIFRYVVDGLEFLREEIVPVLPESIKIRSFLLLKSLTPRNSTTSKEAFKGLNTVLISRVAEFRNMSDAERQNMKGAVLNAVLATPVAAYTEELAAFYQTTRGCYTQANLYGCAGWYFYNRYGFSDPRTVGFLKDPNPYDYSNMPTETQDVGMYISAIFTSTPEEFQASYGAFDAVMTKYRIMVSVLKKIGVSI